MDGPIIGLLGFAFVLVLMFLGLPIGISMLVGGVVGATVLVSLDKAIFVLGTIPFSIANTYTFAVLPLFILMGLIAYEGGLTGELFNSARKLFGHLPGGLAVAVLYADALFSSITGESLAASVIMARVALPEMRKLKYSDKMACGAIATGGTLGPLIPPSAGFILYGIITETSIGELFIAGILPGILLTLLFTASIYTRVKLNPNLALKAPRASWYERFRGLKAVLPVIIIFLVVIGGIYAGIFTPIEAGAVGVFCAFILAFIKRKLTGKGITSALRDTVQATGMVFIILVGAMVFNYLLATSRLPMELAELVLAYQVSPYVVFAFVVVLLLALGCVMDVPAMILLTMPILFPIMTQVGFDPVWFGVISVLVSEAGAITPPVGMNVYVMAGVVKDVPLFDIFQGIWPFFIMMLVCIAIITIFPQICLFLPNLMMK